MTAWFFTVCKSLDFLSWEEIDDGKSAEGKCEVDRE